MSDTTFRDNVVIITGASAGIGRELAMQLAKEGANLVLAARDITRLNTLADECTAIGGKAIAVKTDVAIESDCKNLIDNAINVYGRIDTLINNAGITMWAMFDEIEDMEMIERIMKVNYLGSVYSTHYALPYLKETGGRLVAVSSLTGKTGVPTRTGYAASKHAMAGFFDSLRIELTDTGVSVTMIYPGFVATEVRERALGKNGKPLRQSHIKEGDVMAADECARLIINTMEHRKRELVMTARGKIGLWIKLIAPNLVDKIALKSIATGRT